MSASSPSTELTLRGCWTTHTSCCFVCELFVLQSRLEVLCFLCVIWVVWSVSALTRLVVFRVGCVQQPPCSGVRDAVCFKLDLNIRSVPLLFFFFGFFFAAERSVRGCRRATCCWCESRASAVTQPHISPAVCFLSRRSPAVITNALTAALRHSSEKRVPGL